MKASQDGQRVHCTSWVAAFGWVAVSDAKGGVELAVLVAGGGEGVVDVAARWCRTIGGAEDLRDHVGEDVRRASEAVDARRVDREVEGRTPALTSHLCLDHPMDGVDLVIGLVVDVAQPAKRFDGLFEAVELERQLGDVDGGLDVA